MRANPDIDPARMLDLYLDSAAYPGDDCVDDAMVAAMAHFDGKKDGVIFQNLIRSYAAKAKANHRRGLEYWTEGFSGQFMDTWMEYLTAILGIVVFGNDQLSFKPIDHEWWDLRLPSLGSKNPPNWNEISSVMRDLLGDRYQAHVELCLQEAPTSGWFSWQAWLGLDDVIRRANTTTFAQELARRPFFDCAWYLEERPLIGEYPEYHDIRGQVLHLRLDRPTGFPTLVAFYWRLFYEVATNEDRVAVDEALAEQYSEEAAAAAVDVMELPGGLEVGSYVSGTMRLNDILPAALQIFELATPGTPEDRRQLNEWVDELPDDDHDDWWYGEDPVWMLDEVVDATNEVLGEYGVYLGSNPNDGADFGIWTEEEADF